MHKIQNSKRTIRRAVIAVAAGVASFAGIAFAESHVDAGYASYSAVQGISGNLGSIGSDTLLNLSTMWAESFNKFYPNVKVQIEGKGSTTAPPALIAGTAQLGPMSRTMKDEESDKFEKKFGYKPTPYRVAIDSLAVYVNKDNPIEHLTMEQVDGIFSSTRNSGNSDIKTWGDVGLTGEWANRPISLYGRNSASGTYGYFKEHALFKGDYKSTVKEQPGSAAVVQGVTEDIAGIGYSGIGYKTSGVKAVALSKKQPQSMLKRAMAKLDFIEANYENALSGKYPLARYLYIYVNQKPNTPLDPLVREMLRLIYTKEGQEVVVKDGYDPLPLNIAQEEMAKLK